MRKRRHIFDYEQIQQMKERVIKYGGEEESVPHENREVISRNGPLYIHGDLDIQNFDNAFILNRDMLRNSQKTN